MDQHLHLEPTCRQPHPPRLPLRFTAIEVYAISHKSPRPDRSSCCTVAQAADFPALFPDLASRVSSSTALEAVLVHGQELQFVFLFSNVSFIGYALWIIVTRSRKDAERYELDEQRRSNKVSAGQARADLLAKLKSGKNLAPEGPGKALTKTLKP